MILYALIHHSFKKAFGHRYDGAAVFPYWRAKDLGLEEERFHFTSQHGWELSGSRYYVKGKEFKGLIVFFHGLGDGRASYIYSIALLAKQGYLVYAYDNTGCMESQGNQIYSLEHTLIDQKYFFSWLEKDPKAQGLRRFAVGHSWGGYGACVSAKKEYKIEKVVDIAGFNSVLDSSLTNFPAWGKLLKPWVWLNLKTASGKYGNTKAVNVLSKSKAKVLYIVGKDDRMVTLKEGYEPIYKAFKDNKRFKFIVKEGRGHSVYKDKDAETYVVKLLKDGINSPTLDHNIEMDLVRATKEEKGVWEQIYQFLEED